MLNFQRYHENSALSSLRYDHEAYNVKETTSGALPILTEAIVPSISSCIDTYSVGWGTKITTKDKSDSIVVEYGPSDLIVLSAYCIELTLSKEKPTRNFFI